MTLAVTIKRIRSRLWADKALGEAMRDADAALVSVQARVNALEWRGGHVLCDFGGFPGAASADAQVENQPGVEADSIVRCWIAPADTADHTADEHVVESIDVRCSRVRAGRGFTLTAFSTGTSMLYGKWRLGWLYAGAS